MATCKEAVIDALKELNKVSTTKEVIDYVYRRDQDKLRKPVTLDVILVFIIHR